MLANERKQQFFQAEIFFTKNSIFFENQEMLTIFAITSPLKR